MAESGPELPQASTILGQSAASSPGWSAQMGLAFNMATDCANEKSAGATTSLALAPTDSSHLTVSDCCPSQLNERRTTPRAPPAEAIRSGLDATVLAALLAALPTFSRTFLSPHSLLLRLPFFSRGEAAAPLELPPAAAAAAAASSAASSAAASSAAFLASTRTSEKTFLVNSSTSQLCLRAVASGVRSTTALPACGQTQRKRRLGRRVAEESSLHAVV